MTFTILIILIILLDIITERGLQKTFPKFASLRRKTIRRSLIIQSVASVALMLCGLVLQRRIGDYRFFAWYYSLFGCMATLYVPKAMFAAFLFIDRYIPKTRYIVSKCGFWAGFLVLGIFVWSIFWGRYNFTVEQVEITFDHLPSAFNGYKIVQISDIHTGSFADAANKFQKAVDLINIQEPDLIVMTGDMVNNFAEEITPMIPIFSQMNARAGKFAVLGNHDYGGYHKWHSDADSTANHKAIINNIEQMGFMLLNNQSVVLREDSDFIALAGVENWSVTKRRPKLGNIEKAMEDGDLPFKILLSHDPSFWHEMIRGKTDIALTLSGHTHGMQMGVKIGKKTYSLGILRGFRYLSGLYQKDRQYLYVNRGLGVIGFPGRFGMSPEITVITLHKELTDQ